MDFLDQVPENTEEYVESESPEQVDDTFEDEGDDDDPLNANEEDDPGSDPLEGLDSEVTSEDVDPYANAKKEVTRNPSKSKTRVKAQLQNMMKGK